MELSNSMKHMSTYTSTKALNTQCTPKKCNFNVNVRYLNSALFHEDPKRFTRVNGRFPYGESGSRYNSCLKVTYDSTGAPSTERVTDQNYLRMLLQRQHFLLSYVKTLSVGLAGDS